MCSASAECVAWGESGSGEHRCHGPTRPPLPPARLPALGPAGARARVAPARPSATPTARPPIDQPTDPSATSLRAPPASWQ